MTNQQHPLIPPPRLLQQWEKKAIAPDGFPTEAKWQRKFATLAAQWGADQELESCCEYLKDNELCDPYFYKVFRSARRPKPPSLKEQALALLDKAEDPSWDINDFSIVRRALEQLDD